MPKIATFVAALVLAAGTAVAAEPAVSPTHAIAMHGEPKYGPDFKHFAYVNPDAPKGGEVRLHAIGTFDSLNPFIVKGQPPAGAALPFETLLTSSADEAFTEYGLVAESVEMPEDRSWVAFTLRPEARFHDGSPITVDDVVWSLETLKAKGQPFYRLYYGSVRKAEQVGERKVRFTFDGDGENRELPLIVGQMPILPKKYWENRAFDQTTLEPPMGSGPYRVAAFEPGRHIVYERVRDYWGRDLPVNRGLYNFDRVRYDYYRDTTVALEAFKAGQYDFRLENESKKWATGYEFPAVRQGQVRKERIDNDRPTGMQAYAFNTRRPLFQDPLVRQALAYAFDFEWTNQSLFHGQYTRTSSFFSNSELASEGLPSPAELRLLEPLRDRVPPEVFTKQYEPPSSDGSGNIRGNLRTAMDLLRRAGWTVKDGRLVDAQGRPFAFEILLNQPTWERITLPFTKNLARLGITASVRTVDSAQYKNRVDSFDFDMVVDVWGQSLSPGNEQRSFWGSAAADQPGGRNTVGIKNPAVDALIEAVIAAPDRDDLIARTRALDRVLLWNHYVIPQWHIGYDRVAYWNKFGRPDVVPMQGFQFFAWWIEPQSQAVKPAQRQTGLVPAAMAQEYPQQPTTPGGGAPTPAPITPMTPPPEAHKADPYETAPAGEVVPTPAAESPGVSWWTWIGAALAVVVLLAVRYMRQRR